MLRGFCQRDCDSGCGSGGPAPTSAKATADSSRKGLTVIIPSGRVLGGFGGNKAGKVVVAIVNR